MKTLLCKIFGHKMSMPKSHKIKIVRDPSEKSFWVNIHTQTCERCGLERMYTTKNDDRINYQGKHHE